MIIIIIIIIMLLFTEGVMCDNIHIYIDEI
jgi:hypothetical protein